MSESAAGLPRVARTSLCWRARHTRKVPLDMDTVRCLSDVPRLPRNSRLQKIKLCFRFNFSTPTENVRLYYTSQHFNIRQLKKTARSLPPHDKSKTVHLLVYLVF